MPYVVYLPLKSLFFGDTMLIKSYIILGDIYTTKENFIYVSGFC